MRNIAMQLMTGVMGAALLAIANPVVARAVSYDDAMKSIQIQIKQNQLVAAESALSGLEKQFPGNPEIRGILTRLQCQRHEFSGLHLRRVDQPRSRFLSDALTFCATERTLFQAQQFIDRGEFQEAINILEPLKTADTDSYRTGRLLARAYAAGHRFDDAEREYTALALRFPADRADLQQQAARMRSDGAVAMIDTLSANGDAAAALDRAKALYVSGADPYRSGPLLARLYEAGNQPEEAARIYQSLAERFAGEPAWADKARQLRERIVISRARRSLDEGNPDAAIALLEPLLASGSDPYAAGLLLARAHTAKKQFSAATAVYRVLANRFSSDAEIASLLRQSIQAEQVDKASQLLEAGDNAGAVAYLEPLYASAPDKYGTGLLLARAYRSVGKKADAARLYDELSRAFPEDRTLGPLTLSAYLADKNHPEAQRLYDSFTPDQRVEALIAMGGNSATLFANAISLEGGVAFADNQHGADNVGAVRVKTSFRRGVIVARVARARRFGDSATELGADYYFDLGPDNAGQIGYSRSPGDTFLPHDALTVAISHSLANTDLVGSWRHLKFSDAVADILYTGIAQHLKAATVQKFGIFYVPQTASVSILVGREWIDHHGDKSFASLTVGRVGEQGTFRDGIERANGYSVQLGKLFNLAHRMTLLAGAGYEHRSTSPRRAEMHLELTKGW